MPTKIDAARRSVSLDPRDPEFFNSKLHVRLLGNLSQGIKRADVCPHKRHFQRFRFLLTDSVAGRGSRRVHGNRKRYSQAGL